MNKNLLSIIFLAFFFGVIWSSNAESLKDQDTYIVKGQVISSDDNAPLPGVTVVLKENPSKGSVTDLDGNFSIEVAESDVLVLSYVGFQTKEVLVAGKTQINVILDLDVESLDEVVVVGYGEQKKANLTGAITSVKPEELEDVPVGNLANALVGRMPGVQINRNGTGIPGTDSPLVIRDESASGTVRQVLYVIDGFIYNNDQNSNTGPAGSVIFNRLDPSEIESITVLKDAAAAVYGARGAGGVVIVKTKRGTIGKPKLSYSGSYGVGQATRIPKMMSGYDHAVMMNEISRIQNVPTSINSLYWSPDELAEIENRDFNWLDGLYKSSVTTRNAFNISGGTENVRYFVGGSHYYESGNYESLWYKKYGVRSNLEANLSKNLTMNLGINYSQSKNKRPYYADDEQPGVLRSWYYQSLTAPRWVPAKIDGKPVQFGAWNPHGLLESNNANSDVADNTNISGSLNYDIPGVKGLKWNGTYAYNINSSTTNRYTQDYLVYEVDNVVGSVPSTTLPSDIPTSLASNKEGIREGFSRGNNYQLNTSLNYSRSFDKHNVNALIVYEQSAGRSRSLTASKTGLADLDNTNQFWAFQNAIQLIDGNEYQSGRYSYIGRFNYDYSGKYIFESTFRRESSNKFAPKYRKGIFPSVAVGWVLSEENFVKDNLQFIDFLKLRVSAGRLGNDNVRAFEWKESYEVRTDGAFFGAGDGVRTNSLKATSQGYTVPTRTWSKTDSYNFGIDFTTLDYKLSFSADYYYQFIFDGFQQRSDVAFELGAKDLPDDNYKESMSEGVELMINYNDKIGNDFSYSASVNLSWRHSRPLKLYQNPAVIGTWADELKNDDSNQPGLIALGIIRTDADLEKVKEMYWDQDYWEENSDGEMVPTIDGTPAEKGMIYYKDVGGANYSTEPDGRINGSDDRRIIAKYETPPYSYGFTLGASWKGIRISGTFNGVFGHKAFVKKEEQDVPSSFTEPRNVFAWWGDYWTEENPNAKLPRPYNYGFENQISTFWMRDGHTLRLNNVSLSYSIPKEIMEKHKLPQTRLYCTITNAWTIISPFDWKDPIVSQAYDYPLARTINFGINLSI